jgi:hypothetical protein
MFPKRVIERFANRLEFMELLKRNPGLVILKLGAEWCGPCQQIKSTLMSYFSKMPDEVICCDVDVDESSDLYSFLKSKRMVNGIPVILCYCRGNVSYIPDDAVTGSGRGEIDAFFNRCIKRAQRIRAEQIEDSR